MIKKDNSKGWLDNILPCIKDDDNELFYKSELCSYVHDHWDLMVPAVLGRQRGTKLEFNLVFDPETHNFLLRITNQLTQQMFLVFVYDLKDVQSGLHRDRWNEVFSDGGSVHRIIMES